MPILKGNLGQTQGWIWIQDLERLHALSEEKVSIKDRNEKYAWLGRLWGSVTYHRDSEVLKLREHSYPVCKINSYIGVKIWFYKTIFPINFTVDNKEILRDKLKLCFTIGKDHFLSVRKHNNGASTVW